MPNWRRMLSFARNVESESNNVLCVMLGVPTGMAGTVLEEIYAARYRRIECK